MEEQWILNTLQNFLPEEALHFINDHILPSDSPFQIFRRRTTVFLQSALSTILPILEPLYERVALAVSNSPDVVILAFALMFIVLVLQILNWVRRVMMWWTRFTMRMVFYAVIVALGAMVWQRGPEAAARDVVVVVSKLVGYAAVVKDIWWSEFKKYEAQTQGAGRAANRATRQATAGRRHGR